MLTRPPEIEYLVPRTRSQRIEAKKQRREQTSKWEETQPIDLIGFNPWPEWEEPNVTLS